MVVEFHTENSKIVHYCLTITSHLAYVATLTKSDGVKMDGFLYPNFMYIPKKFLHHPSAEMKNHPFPNVQWRLKCHNPKFVTCRVSKLVATVLGWTMVLDRKAEWGPLKLWGNERWNELNFIYQFSGSKYVSLFLVSLCHSRILPENMKLKEIDQSAWWLRSFSGQALSKAL